VIDGKAYFQEAIQHDNSVNLTIMRIGEEEDKCVRVPTAHQEYDDANRMSSKLTSPKDEMQITSPDGPLAAIQPVSRHAKLSKRAKNAKKRV